MPVSHWRHGAIMAGYIRMTRVAGFSGIVAITSAGAWALKTGVRSDVGRQCADTFHRSGRTASQAIRYAAHGSAKDRKSTRLNSSHVKISYAVFCLKKKKTKQM